ncbi:MAG: CubicO group peptidase (beta-lactamase class C family) [Cellvibrionaceae bacterium]|jgi:CubicO group peptidase (beta-lactamase class C family)
MNRKAKLEAFVTQKMEELSIPGVSVGILTADGPEIHTFGVTNVNHPMQVTADTLFQIGSNTKTMTATLMMMLAYEGKLDFDAPICSVLPGFKVKDETVSAAATIRQLLTHSTGWVGDHFIETGSGADAKEKYVASMAELGQLAPPDTAASYNNAAFAVAGRIIEVITGKLYESAIVDMLFKPLGMDHSFIEMGDVMLRSFAVGHDVTPEGDSVVEGPWPLPRAMYSVGAVAASAGDMLTYAQFYLNHGKTADGTQLLSPEAIEELWTPQFDTGSNRGWVAHSWFVENNGGHNSYCHGGATVGQMSAFKVIPDKNFAFTSLTNAESGRLFNVAIEAWLLEHYCDIIPSVLTAITPSAEQLQELVGTYSRPMQDIEINLDDGGLQMRAVPKQGFPTADVPPRPPSPWFPIGLVSENVFMAKDGPAKGAQGQMVRKADGSIGWIRSGLRLHVKQ